MDVIISMGKYATQRITLFHISGFLLVHKNGASNKRKTLRGGGMEIKQEYYLSALVTGRVFKV